MRVKRLIIMAMSLITVSFGLAGCKAGNEQAITVVGSSALQPLVEMAGEAYTAKHPDSFVNVQGGGSGTGLSQIQSGAVAIGNSDLFAEEKKGIDASALVDHQVAVVGVTPIVNKQVTVKNLTTAQLRDVFTGRVTNWKQLGGQDLPIVIVNRAQGSGTRVTFERWVLDGQPAIAAQEQDSTGMVRQIVANTPGAISYMAFSYVDKTVRTLNVDGVAPTDANVHTNAWQIWAYEHMYTKGQPKGLTRDFLQYVLSKQVQETVVKKMGYISVHDMQVRRDSQGNLIEKEG